MNYIVIDAIDECKKDERTVLLDFLRKVTLLTKPIFKIYLATRDDVGEEIRKISKTFYHLPMSSPEVSQDIATYIEGVIEEKKDKGDIVVRDPNLFVEIRDALIKGAQGMCVSHEP